MPRDPDRDVHTPETFGAAYAALSDAEIFRLDRISVAMARRGGLEAKDLLQSAVEAVLADRRPWPTGVELTAFLTGVMRSLLSGETRRRDRSSVVQPVSLFDPDVGVEAAVDASPSIETLMIQREDVARITDWLIARCDGDDAASTILIGLMTGQRGKDLREATGLNQVAFDSKRRWVRRQIDECLAREDGDE